MTKVRRIIEARRGALEAVTKRLMECEVINGTELKTIVDASTGMPQIVPGTDTDRRPARAPLTDGGELPGTAEA
jgi:cell division protease FtsH